MNSSKHALAKTDIDTQTAPTVYRQQPPTWAEAPMMAGSGGTSWTSYLEIPFMHKRMIVTCTLFGLLAGWLAIVAWPRTYHSQAKILMNVGRESVSLDPTATTAQTLMLQKTQDEEIISALDMLGSRQVAELVIDQLGVDAVLSGQLPGGTVQEAAAPPRGLDRYTATVKNWAQEAKQALQRALLAAGIKDEIGDRELAVLQLQGAVHIGSPRKSSIIDVEARSKTPEMAQAIVQQFVACFRDEHLDGAFTEGSLDFFQSESDDSEANLLMLEKERSEFMQENEIVSIEGKREAFQQQLSSLSRDLIVAYGQLEQAFAEEEDLIWKEDAEEEEITAERLQATDPTWSGMRQQIYELELQVQEAHSKYKPLHPELKRLEKQLLGAQEILSQLKADRVDSNTQPNPVKRRIAEQLQRAQTLIVGLESTIEEKETRHTKMCRQIDDMLDHERQLAEMDRGIRHAGEEFDRLQEKREEARIISELHAKKISNLNVFQPATFVERPVSPKKKLLAVGFLFLGITSGIGLSLLKQISSPTLRTSEDVESQLGCPVVASIPRVSSGNLSQRKQQKLFRQQCQPLISEIMLSQRQPGDRRGRTVGVIGVDVGAGASTIAAHLAMTSGEDFHLQTLLVDADSRQRSVSKFFGLNGTPGLIELVGGIASHDECVQRAENSEFDLIASSGESCNEYLTAEAPEIAQALQAYLEDTELLIVDLPAASQPDHAVALAQHLDCVLVVIESEKTQTAKAERLLRRLSQSDAEVVGIVITKTRTYLPKIVRSFVTPQV